MLVAAVGISFFAGYSINHPNNDGESNHTNEFQKKNTSKKRNINSLSLKEKKYGARPDIKRLRGRVRRAETREDVIDQAHAALLRVQQEIDEAENEQERKKLERKKELIQNTIDNLSIGHK